MLSISVNLYHILGANVLVTASLMDNINVIVYIFTGNLPFKATEDDLIKFLKLSPQTVVEIPVFRYNPRRKIGIAFVSVDVDCVEEVLKFNGEEMMERKLKVALAKNQSKPERWQQRKVPSRSAAVSVCIKICSNSDTTIKSK